MQALSKLFAAAVLAGATLFGTQAAHAWWGFGNWFPWSGGPYYGHPYYGGYGYPYGGYGYPYGGYYGYPYGGYLPYAPYGGYVAPAQPAASAPTQSQ